VAQFSNHGPLNLITTFFHLETFNSSNLEGHFVLFPKVGHAPKLWWWHIWYQDSCCLSLCHTISKIALNSKGYKYCDFHDIILVLYYSRQVLWNLTMATLHQRQSEILVWFIVDALCGWLHKHGCVKYDESKEDIIVVNVLRELDSYCKCTTKID
jgi:hypothetical protein